MPTATTQNSANETIPTLPVVLVTDMDAKNEKADALIERYALFGTATGLIPTFGLDVAAATALQTKMIRDLAEIYDYDIDDQLIRTAITTCITAIGGRLVSVLAEMAAKSFSPLKMLMGGATAAAVSGFLTLEIGKIYQARMQKGQNPADIGVLEIINHIVAQIQEGKWDPTSFSVTNQLSNFMGSNKK